MDDSRFDVWTRRRFGLATGGALAAALGIAAPNIADAKRKKRGKRCRKLHQTCRPAGARRQKCCKPLRCVEETPGSPEINACCRRVQTACAADDECCSGLCRDNPAMGGLHCCTFASCQATADCCFGTCEGGVCTP